MIGAGDKVGLSEAMIQALGSLTIPPEEILAQEERLKYAEEKKLRDAGRADMGRDLEDGVIEGDMGEFAECADQCVDGDAYACGEADALADHVWKPEERRTSVLHFPNMYVVAKLPGKPQE